MGRKKKANKKNNNYKNNHKQEKLVFGSRLKRWIFALIFALSELGIAPQFMQILFTGVVATLVISFGLAFGLGGRDAAANAITKIKDQMSNRE